MKIALIGANGKIGSRILKEALSRGHKITGITRNPPSSTTTNKNLTWAQVDVLNTSELSETFKGHDAIISAFGLDWTKPESFHLFSDAAQSIIEAAKKAKVKRLLNVGGAGSLEVAPGIQLVDTPEFPAAYKQGANAQRNSLNVFRNENDLDWTFFSPALLIEPGPRTGNFRLGKDNPIFDAEGKSSISRDDYAVAMIDELETPQFIKQRFTIGY